MSPEQVISDNQDLLSPYIRSELRRMEAGNGHQERLKAISQLITMSRATKFKSLREGVEASKLPASQVSALRKNAKAVVSVEQLLQRSDIDEAYILGLSRDGEGYRDPSYASSYSAFAAALGMKKWTDAYEELGLDLTQKGIGPTFMKNLTASEKPIVMFVPNGAFSYVSKDAKYPASYTREELEWYFDNPESMKNTIFVFGGYDLFPIEVCRTNERAGMHAMGDIMTAHLKKLRARLKSRAARK